MQDTQVLHPVHFIKHHMHLALVNVNVNGAAVVRIGDATGCGDPAVGGSGTVKVNGQGVHRVGDGTGGHGSWVPNSSAGGSSNVIAGG